MNAILPPPTIPKPCSICRRPFAVIGSTGVRYCPNCDTAKGNR